MPRGRTFGPTACAALVLAAQAAAAETMHHIIDVRLDPLSREIRIEDRFEVEGTIAFDLAPWLTIVTAEVDGRPAAVDRTEHGATLQVGSGEVSMVLEGIVPPLPEPDERTPRSGPVAGEEGSFLPASAAWLPDTGEPLTYELTIEVPAPHRAVATGRLVDERVAEETYRATFASDGTAEPPSLFTGPWVVSEKRDGDLRLRTWFHPEAASLSDEYLRDTATYIRRFSDLIGPYPFADFHIVSAALPVGLGFPGLTYVGRMVLPLPFMRGRSLAHEVLHSWWGNGVGIDYASGNWAEGLTTYLADYGLAEEEGDEAAREMRLGWLRNLAALPPGEDMPVVRFVAKRHDATQVVGYDKVAFIFHMLKAEVGEAAFRAGLRRLWDDHRIGVAGWADLEAAFSAASGRDLAWFFDQWLHRAGQPRVEIVGAKRQQAGGVELTLRQSEPVYRLRLPVIIETTGGSERQVVELERSEQTFVLQPHERPLAVQVDPDFELLRQLLDGESPPILRDVTLSRETVLVLPTGDDRFAGIAHQLAQRLLQRDPTVHHGDPAALQGVPVVVIGAGDDVEVLRTRLGLTIPEGDVTGAGTARAWTGRGPGRVPWLFVTANDADALEALRRPLPHYRSRSYVVFEGTRATAKGVWTMNSSPLRLSLGP